MEKRIRSSHIVILTAVSCLLFACVITSPVLFTDAESRNGGPAAEASMLAERHLDRAMEEMKRTGNCSVEGRTMSCDDGCGSVYVLDTRIARGPSGEISRISVRVKWNGPLGGGAVVATGICGRNPGYGRASISGGPANGVLTKNDQAGTETPDKGTAEIREVR